MPAKRLCTGCGRMRPEAGFRGVRGKLCLTCRQARAKAAHRRQRVAEYDITLEEYEKLFAAQGGKCAGCGGTRRYSLHVDHSHRVEREQGTRASVRGLLCARCNTVLRKVGDDPQTLRSLAEFLENPPARKVLLGD